MSCFEHSSNQLKPVRRENAESGGAELMQPRQPTPTPRDRKNGRSVKESKSQATGVYLPNNNILTPNMRSPDYVQMSTAAAITLGIMKGNMYGCSCTR